ncbi:hydroxypyruvate isomerase [Azospirillum brasilense]|uniref:hydroxypyruvate isomerase n=1 Tax=Azospirillum argentinense TaxID=2970906 RepID=UPI00190B19E3|nr:hydroxypyruvate isomerase [Azospirillum argentinense]MBK3800384.1 hydroxypyruvate isomerase [Azospirillum argentinense]
MPKFAANLTMLYNELPFLDRFAAAAKDGFTGVEYLFPYAFEKDALVERLAANRLTQVLHNLPAGDWDAGERGIAVLPDRVGEFQDGVGRAIEYATALGCKQINCLAGKAPASVAADALERTFVDNLSFAAKALKQAGIRFLIEPINTRDIPGFYLTNTAQAERILEAVGSDNLFIQYDVYHMQIMEGDLVPTIQRLLPKIAHVQIADNPGRNEPGTGEINYPFVFAALDRIGYDGWVGCEYKPARGTSEGLGWMRAATPGETVAA